MYVDSITSPPLVWEEGRAGTGGYLYSTHYIVWGDGPKQQDRNLNPSICGRVSVTRSSRNGYDDKST